MRNMKTLNEKEILKVKIKKGKQSAGREYEYVDETIYPGGRHVVNVIAVDSVKGKYESFRDVDNFTFLFPQHLRKRFHRYYKREGIEYDHNKYWKEPTLGG